MTERRGRGRLSSIQLLPEDATPHVLRAIEELKKMKRPQEAIREELNGHLLALGLDPVSRSAFHRYGLRLAIQGEKLMRFREVAAIWGEKLKDAPKDDVSLLLNETMTVMIYDLVTEHQINDEAVSMKMMRTPR